MFDEPSSYLDVKQRLKAALAIRSLLAGNKYGKLGRVVGVVRISLLAFWRK